MAEGRDFVKFLRSLEQFFLTVGQNNIDNKIPFSSTKKPVIKKRKRKHLFNHGYFK